MDGFQTIAICNFRILEGQTAPECDGCDAKDVFEPIEVGHGDVRLVICCPCLIRKGREKTLMRNLFRNVEDFMVSAQAGMVKAE